MAVYLHADYEPYSNAEAAEHLADENHLNGNIGDFWSGTHPAFALVHSSPFTAVIDLKTGKVKATDPIPQVLTADEIMDAVEALNTD